MKVYGKIFFVLLVAISVIGLSGCKDQASDKTEKKAVETKVDQNKQSNKPTGNGAQTEEQKVQDLIMKDTNIVQISNISRRTNPTYPDMGPFFVIRGMDYRGQVQEVWIKDLKIYQLTTQKTTP